MFGNFARKSKAEELALEVVGLVSGLRDVNRAGGNVLAGYSVGRLAGKIGKALAKEKGIDGDTRSFLEQSQEHLAALGKKPSAQVTGHVVVTRFGAHPVYRPDPTWERSFQRFRDAMTEPTQQFIEARRPKAAATEAMPDAVRPRTGNR
jgi:hypothetical protein